MKQQDKLRNSLREHYDNQETPFVEDDWRQASALLAKAKTKRKRKGLAVIFFTLLFLLSGLLFFVTSTDSNPNDVKVELAIAKPESPATVVEQKDISSTIKQQQIQARNKIPLSASQVHEKKNSEQAWNLSNNNQVIQGELNPTSEQPGIQVQSIQKQGAPDVRPSDVSESKTSSENEEKTDVNDLALDATGPINTSNTETLEEGSTTPNAQNPELPSEPFIPVAPSPSYEPTANDAIINNQLAVQEQVADSSSNSGSSQAKTQQDSCKVEDIASAEFIDPYLTKPTLTEGLFMEAGANWYYGWSGFPSRDASGLSPLIGLHYMNHLSARHAFSYGLVYSNVPGLFNTSKTSRVSSYVYGEQSDVTVITPSSLHYLIVPLRFHRVINRWSSVGAGLNLAYLLSVRSEVTSYTELPGLSENYNTVKLWGYTEGFSRYDAQLVLNYRLRFSKSIALQAEGFFGLKDVKDDDFFRLKNKERNSGMKLSLIYYVFRKK